MRQLTEADMRRFLLVAVGVLLALLGPMAVPSHAEGTSTLDRAKRLSATQVQITGTVTCPVGDYFYAYAGVEQTTGLQGYVYGSGGTDLTDCTGTPQSVIFTAFRDPYVSTANFRSGRASVTFAAHRYAEVCYHDPEYGEYCYVDYVETLGSTTKSMRI